MKKVYIRPEKLTKVIPSISYTQHLGLENSKKSAIKNMEHEKIFYAGQKWYYSKNKLSDARTEYKIDGKEMTDDEFRAFRAGYMYIARADAYTFGKMEVDLETLPVECVNNKEYMDLYREGRGFTCGYNGLAVYELPKEFVGSKAFILGYRRGIQEKANEPENKKRR